MTPAGQLMRRTPRREDLKESNRELPDPESDFREFHLRSGRGREVRVELFAEITGDQEEASFDSRFGHPHTFREERKHRSLPERLIFDCHGVKVAE